MNRREDIRNRMEIVLVVVVASIVIFAQARYMFRRTQPSFYFLAQDAIASRIRPAVIVGFSSPWALNIQPIDDRSTNVAGWLVKSNISGSVSTQWFRCVIEDSPRKPKILAVEFSTNAAAFIIPSSAKPSS